MECRGQIMVLSMFLNSIIQDGISCDLALIPTIEFQDSIVDLFMLLNSISTYVMAIASLLSADPAHRVPAWFV